MDSTNSNINSNGLVTYKLQVPLIHGTDRITQLTFMKPKLKHVRVMDEAHGDTDRLAKLLVVLCNLPPPVIDEIDAIDLAAIGDIIASFFPSAPKTSSEAKPH